MRGADDAVVVLAADVALELDGGVVELVCHFLNEHRGSLVGEIEEGIEVEVSVATMSVYSGRDVKFFKEFLDFGEELTKLVWWYGHVFEESRWTLVGILELRQSETSATYLPEHLSFNLAGDYSCASLLGTDSLHDVCLWSLVGCFFIKRNENSELWCFAAIANMERRVHIEHGAVVVHAG